MDMTVVTFYATAAAAALGFLLLLAVYNRRRLRLYLILFDAVDEAGLRGVIPANLLTALVGRTLELFDSDAAPSREAYRIGQIVAMIVAWCRDGREVVPEPSLRYVTDALREQNATLGGVVASHARRLSASEVLPRIVVIAFIIGWNASVFYFLCPEDAEDVAAAGFLVWLFIAFGMAFDIVLVAGFLYQWIGRRLFNLSSGAKRIDGGD